MNSSKTKGGFAPRENRLPTKLIVTATFILLTVALTGCFKVSSDTAALRTRLMKASGTEWDEKVEFGVGRITLGLARAGLAFVDIDADARTALNAARGAEVGVYQRKQGGGQFNHAAILSDADSAMAARGWDRMITVIDKQELVMVFVPAAMRSPKDVKACVAVLNDRELVVASVRGNLEPIMELAARHSELGKKRIGLVRL